ncbi:MAG TPA: TIGR04086 family membrane protein [Oscillospiraceae bacterium]|nr:TIGR04086 family membrane protein [Oscillospiraceae bacterium]HPS35580.1 TIGR04086 family membrane protein [Oscillospiraceae bacterium]
MKKIILYAVFSILISTAVCLATAIIFSAGASVCYIGAVGWILCGITGLTGGLMSARAIRRKCVLNGMLCAFFAFVILFVLGLFFGNGVMFLTFFIKLAVCLVSGAVGGFIGAGNKHRKSRAH